MGAVTVDDGRDLDDRVVGQVRDRAVVPNVDDLHVAGAVVEGRDELRRGLAVERPAAMIEELGLLVERRVAVHLEETSLDVHDVTGAGVAVLLLSEHGPRHVVVAEVVGRDRAHPADQVGRHPQFLGELVRILVEQVRQSVDPIDADGPLPAQVVEPDVLELDPLRGHVEPCRKATLELDGHVAQPERPVAVVEERLGDDPDRVGEVDDPGVLGRPLRGELRELEHERHGPQRLGEPAGAGRLLADDPEPSGSVSSTRRAAWPPTRSWMSTKSAPSIAASRSPVSVTRPVQPSRSSIRCASPPTTSSRSGSMSSSTSSSIGRRSPDARSPRPARACTCCRRRRP